MCFFLIYLSFRYMQGIVEDFLAPGISFINDKLNFSEAMGAVTLLALANGAGDVLTALAASANVDGIQYNIGSIYGSSLFVTTIIIALTIFDSKEDIQLNKNTVYRDIGFYILSTFNMVVFGIIGELTVITSLILLIQYVILVVIVYYTDSNEENEKDHQSLV